LSHTSTWRYLYTGRANFVKPVSVASHLGCNIDTS